MAGSMDGLKDYLSRLLSPILYVRITRNRFRIRNIQDQNVVELAALQPFTSTRMLVGNFTAAEKLLQQGVQKAIQRRFLTSSAVLMHPLEMIEGGLSQIEERALMELAAGAGARKVLVWTGQELSDKEVLTRMSQAK